MPIRSILYASRNGTKGGMNIKMSHRLPEGRGLVFSKLKVEYIDRDRIVIRNCSDISAVRLKTRHVDSYLDKSKLHGDNINLFRAYMILCKIIISVKL